MKRFFSLSILFGLVLSMSAFAEETPIQYAFSGATAEENKVILQGAGFGAYPQASVSFGLIPTDNAFDGATDGQGAIVTAQPGEGVMIFGERIIANQAAMIRCSVRTEQAHAAITIATIGDKPDRFVATNSPSDEAYFAGQYQRLSTFCTPPSTGFQPVVQIVNTSQTEALTAYIDNFEVYTLDPTKYYSAAFLDNDTVDPPAEQISIPSDSSSALEASDLTINFSTTVKCYFIKCNNGTLYRKNESIPFTHSFYIGQTEVTQKQWKAIMGDSDNPSEIAGDDLPVTNVSYNRALEFIAKLNQKNKGRYRLPTALEWEYACRAGTSTRYYWGDSAEKNTMDPYAWCKYNSDSAPHTVGTKTPNAWHLYDMMGNVREWSSDMGNTPEIPLYLCCGGYFSESISYYSSNPADSNDYQYPTANKPTIGFRLVREVN